jgi:hypothetical protein
MADPEALQRKIEELLLYAPGLGTARREEAFAPPHDELF